MMAVVIVLVMVSSSRHVTGGLVVASTLHHNHSDITLAGKSTSTCRGVILQLNYDETNDDHTSDLRYRATHLVLN